MLRGCHCEGGPCSSTLTCITPVLRTEYSHKWHGRIHRTSVYPVKAIRGGKLTPTRIPYFWVSYKLIQFASTICLLLMVKSASCRVLPLVRPPICVGYYMWETPSVPLFRGKGYELWAMSYEPWVVNYEPPLGFLFRGRKLIAVCSKLMAHNSSS